jgi:hypothetical protein
MNSDQVLAKIYATKIIWRGRPKMMSENVEVLYLGAMASKLIPYPVTKHLQKGSKTTCDEPEHFDIFPQSIFWKGINNFKDYQYFFLSVLKVLKKTISKL